MMMMKREEAMGGEKKRRGPIFKQQFAQFGLGYRDFPPIRLSVHVQHHIAYYYLVSMKDYAAILLVFKFGSSRRSSDGFSWPIGCTVGLHKFTCKTYSTVCFGTNWTPHQCKISKLMRQQRLLLRGGVQYNVSHELQTFYDLLCVPI